ncbi:hypothetical protein [Pontibacter sp. SGAir0037]|uniref:hypothetical protein n=1 Tax=Pontibacter sp. SGAir0037 TaxID=2571030 RepID=UPI001F0F00B2|nr:hypothetical protein [Pontibacter sp. SGAir0037]
MSKAASFFSVTGLSSSRRSLVMQVVAWILNLAWLGINYFWKLVPVAVLVAIPVLLLLYAFVALIAYIYWGMRQVKEDEAPYANVMVGVIVALTLLYLNFKFLQFILQLSDV